MQAFLVTSRKESFFQERALVYAHINSFKRYLRSLSHALHCARPLEYRDAQGTGSGSRSSQASVKSQKIKTLLQTLKTLLILGIVTNSPVHLIFPAPGRIAFLCFLRRQTWTYDLLQPMICEQKWDVSFPGESF